jgi:hypothetical protein
VSQGARLWLLVAILVVLHLFLHVGLGLGVAAPDLATIGLLLAAREIGLGPAALVGLLLGLLEDALSVLAFGANSVAMTIVAIGGAFTRDLFVGDSRLFVVLYFLIGKWVRDVLHWVSVGEGIRQPFVDQVLIQGAIGSVYAAVIGLGLMTLAASPGDA